MEEIVAVYKDTKYKCKWELTPDDDGSFLVVLDNKLLPFVRYIVEDNEGLFTHKLSYKSQTTGKMEFELLGKYIDSSKYEFMKAIELINTSDLIDKNYQFPRENADGVFVDDYGYVWTVSRRQNLTKMMNETFAFPTEEDLNADIERVKAKMTPAEIEKAEAMAESVISRQPKN